MEEQIWARELLLILLLMTMKEWEGKSYDIIMLGISYLDNNTKLNYKLDVHMIEHSYFFPLDTFAKHYKIIMTHVRWTNSWEQKFWLD